MNALDRLTESPTFRASSGNPLELLPPRQRAVIVLLGSGFQAKTVAHLLHITRETLYQDRRAAWLTLTPVAPGAIAADYVSSRASWKDRARPSANCGDRA